MSSDRSKENDSLIKTVQQLQREKEALKMELQKHQRKPSGKTGFVLLCLGLVAFISSMFFNSSILALIGLGLTFWGVLFQLVKPVKYVKKAILDSQTLSLLVTLDTIVTSLDYHGKGIYLPSQNLKGLRESRIFIPAKDGVALPSIKKVMAGKVFLNGIGGICLPPPGLSLAILFEKELGVDLSKVGLSFLCDNLPRLLVEDLELVENLEIEIDKEKIHVKMVKPIYRGLCNEVLKTTNFCSRFGCPLCSSIASVLAETIHKPITIERNKLTSHTIDVWYHIVGGQPLMTEICPSK